MQADINQHKAITSIYNTVVRASAGSGKTSVLAHRYVNLVQKKRVPITEILCLTFTRKAASEMYQKIYSLLNQQKDSFIQEQLHNFEHSCISTIDSFCADIVRNNALTFGITPANSSDPAEHRALLQKLALDTIIREQDSDIVMRIIAHRSLKDCTFNLLVPIIEQHSSIAYPLNFTAVWQNVKETARNQKKILLQELLDSITCIMKLPKNSADIILRAQKTLECWYEQTAILEECAEAIFQTVTAFDLRKGAKRNNLDVNICKEHIQKLRTCSATLCSMNFLNEEPQMLEFYSLMQHYQEAVIKKKQETGIYSYRDIAEFAIYMLRNPQIRQYYKKRFRHIMIDEFQDNNARQRDLLYLLAEKHSQLNIMQPQPADLELHKLFLVGDEKQSIYSFRGADLQMFLHLQNDMQTYGSNISLLTNYRSTDSLVAFFNTVFTSVMEEQESKYETMYETTHAAPRKEQSTPSIIKIALHKGKKDEKNPDVLLPVQAEAWWVAGQIKELLQQGLSENDIAILFRSSTSIRYFEQGLLSHNIAYSTRSTRSLFTEAPANDLYALLRLYFYPEDMLNYASVLRSPLINISDNSLVKILSQYDANNPPPLFQTEQDISAKDRNTFEQAKALYNWSRKQLANMTSMQFVHLFWYNWGYRYALLQKSDYHPYLEHYDYLINIAQRWNNSLPRFMQKIHTLINNKETLDEAPPTAGNNAVQLMTIHAAKGLEFPAVFVCDMATPEHSHRDYLYSFIPGKDIQAPIIFPDYYPGNYFAQRKQHYFQQYSKEDRQKQSAAELKRLLYVALTRAQRHLFLSAHKKRSGSKSDDITLFSFLQKSLVNTPYTVEEIPDICKTERKSRLQERKSVEGLLRHTPCVIRNIYKNSFTPTEIGRLREKGSRQEGCKKDYKAQDSGTLSSQDFGTLSSQDFGTLSSQDFGTLCHRILELRIQDNNITYAETQRETQDIVKQTDNNAEKIQEKAWQLSQVFFDSELWQECRNAEVKPEVNFIYRHEYTGSTEGREQENIYISGRIDVIFVFKDKTVLVDFKTSRKTDDEQHILQLSLYRKVCAELYGKPVTPYLFYLYEGAKDKSKDTFPHKKLTEILNDTIQKYRKREETEATSTAVRRHR